MTIKKTNTYVGSTKRDIGHTAAPRRPGRQRTERWRESLWVCVVWSVVWRVAFGLCRVPGLVVSDRATTRAVRTRSDFRIQNHKSQSGNQDLGPPCHLLI
jgi:hypothetical protein